MHPRQLRPNYRTPDELERNTLTHSEYCSELRSNALRCPKWIIDQCSARRGQCVPCEVRDQLAEMAQPEAARPAAASAKPPTPRIPIAPAPSRRDTTKHRGAVPL